MIFDFLFAALLCTSGIFGAAVGSNCGCAVYPDALKRAVQEELHGGKKLISAAPAAGCFNFCQFCTQGSVTTATVAPGSITTTTESTTATRYVDPKTHTIYTQVKCDLPASPTGSRSASTTLNPAAVHFEAPKNLLQLNRSINDVNIPEDVRSILKALAIYDTPGFSKNPEQIKQVVESDALTNPPYVLIDHESPIGFDKSEKIAILYYSNKTTVEKQNPQDLMDLRA